MSIGSYRRFGGLVASIFVVDRKSSGQTYSKALQPILGLWSSYFWGFETVEFLREEDGRLKPDPPSMEGQGKPRCSTWVSRRPGRAASHVNVNEAVNVV